MAFIFAHSPERPPTPLTADASRWMEHTRDEITQAALKSGTAQDILRRSLAPGDKSETKVGH